MTMPIAMGFGAPPEWIIIAALALIVFGPKKLPEVGRQLGQAMKEFRKMADELTGVVHSVRDEVTTVATSARDDVESSYRSMERTPSSVTMLESDHGGQTDSYDPMAPAYPERTIRTVGPLKLSTSPRESDASADVKGH
ncbi:twin-arginine translocase TatA/TatE family subunit [Capsulimonas sp.]|uniref:Sec-independent protein translocase subunit TatA/TatB n=1 Tax=Capsulimonas sp. TaxID=2494211 RepID=UPI003262ED9E